MLFSLSFAVFIYIYICVCNCYMIMTSLSAFQEVILLFQENNTISLNRLVIICSKRYMFTLKVYSFWNSEIGIKFCQYKICVMFYMFMFYVVFYMEIIIQ